METLKLKCSSFHHQTLLSNCEILYWDVFALSILWMVYCPFWVVYRASGLLLWLLWFLRYIVVFEWRNNMVGRYLIKHFCGGGMGRLKIYFLFGCSTRRVRGLWQRERCVEKKCGLEMCWEHTRKSNKDNKKLRWRRTTWSFSGTNLLYWLGEWLWDQAEGFVRMLLYL